MGECHDKSYTPSGPLCRASLVSRPCPGEFECIQEFRALAQRSDILAKAANAEVARLIEVLRLAEADAARLAGVIRDYDVPGCSEWGDAEAAGSFNCDPRCTHSGTECPTRFAALAAHAARLAEGKQ